MKKLLLGAVVLAMLASCSNDEEGALRPKSDQIGFSGVFSNTLTRAANGYCNNNKPETFKALFYYEATAGSNEFSNLFKYTDFTTSDFTIWEPATGSYVWPVDKNSSNQLKVWAYTIPSGSGSGYNYGYYDSTNKTFEVGYTIPTVVANQNDICVASYIGTRGDITTIPLNFKHVLSQIDFAVKNGNKTTHVEVSDVKVMNVKGKNAKIYFPTATTTAGKNHSDGTYSTESYGGATVDVSNTLTDTYQISFSGMAQVAGGKTVNLSASTSEEWATNTMYLLPQTSLKSSTFTVSSTTAPASDIPCIAVNLNIWNVSGTSVNKDTDVLLFGEKNVGTWIYIPFPNAEWLMGKRYHYTLVVTGATGSLDEIKLDCFVDDFYPNGETEI
ncbi:MAG: fimbrillin family protein [Lepagella sp.]